VSLVSSTTLGLQCSKAERRRSVRLNSPKHGPKLVLKGFKGSCTFYCISVIWTNNIQHSTPSKSTSHKSCKKKNQTWSLDHIATNILSLVNKFYEANSSLSCSATYPCNTSQPITIFLPTIYKLKIKAYIFLSPYSS
jgi:hypothetical protein